LNWFHGCHDLPDSLIKVKEPQHRGLACCPRRSLHPVQPFTELFFQPDAQECLVGIRAAMTERQDANENCKFCQQATEEVEERVGGGEKGAILAG
jgi:hypothetical protein